MSNITQSDPNFAKLILLVPNLGAQAIDLLYTEIPLFKFYGVENMDERTLLRSLSTLYLCGNKHGQNWLPEMDKHYDSDEVIRVFKDFCPNEDWRFFRDFYNRYPFFKNLPWHGLLIVMKNLSDAVEHERVLGNRGYLRHNERAIVHYFAHNYTEGPLVVPVDSEYHVYIMNRLHHQAVLHLRDVVDGVLYSCITGLRDGVLTLSGSRRSLPYV